MSVHGSLYHRGYLTCNLIDLPLFCVCLVFVQSERLQKLQLEDLREFLQEQLAVSFFLPDDVVVEQLQAAMSELRSKKLDQPPPGAVVSLFNSLNFSAFNFLFGTS